MGLLPENARHSDLEEQEVRGLWGQNFGAGTSFVGAVDELIVAHKSLRRKWIVQAEKAVTDWDWHYSPRCYWRVVGMLVAAKEQNEMRVGLMGNVEERGSKRRVGGQVNLCVLVTGEVLAEHYRVLSKVVNEEGWLHSTFPACSTCEGIGDLTVNHRSALFLETVVGLCLGRLVGLVNLLNKVYWRWWRRILKPLLLLHDVVCIMCIIDYIGFTAWDLRLMVREVDFGLNLTMCIENRLWV